MKSLKKCRSQSHFSIYSPLNYFRKILCVFIINIAFWKLCFYASYIQIPLLWIIFLILYLLYALRSHIALLLRFSLISYLTVGLFDLGLELSSGLQIVFAFVHNVPFNGVHHDVYNRNILFKRSSQQRWDIRIKLIHNR